ncbi:hypothetical protein Phi46:1_gp26 [Cellulophaga phage phi46:1]|uniref:hypothetical protein n=1 Tax=Cellulophaga phage phi46:1 TaxID=1327974 RepID=UPI000351D7B8|nr:hypothetical protein Phi46:1_gp26 [Cellulophaga phage phi46:1]AGO47837.1 hypothetical protein Phi46:1_gp26 [Cellulophaga phage phi46:1]
MNGTIKTMKRIETLEQTAFLLLKSIKELKKELENEKQLSDTKGKALNKKALSDLITNRRKTILK